VSPVAMATNIIRTDTETIVCVTGDVDLVTAAALRTALVDALPGTRRLTVDVAGMTFIDSSGLSALVDAHHRAQEAGAHLTIRHPSSMLQRLLHITRLETLLTVEDSGPAALPTTDGH
jgi:anti-sigma B factor antagonist